MRNSRWYRAAHVALSHPGEVPGEPKTGTRLWFDEAIEGGLSTELQVAGYDSRAKTVNRRAS